MESPRKYDMSKRAALRPYMGYYASGIPEQGIRLIAASIHRLWENNSVDNRTYIFNYIYVINNNIIFFNYVII